MPGIDPLQYKSYDEFAKAVQASPKYRSIQDPAFKTNVLNSTRKMYFEAHGVHQEIGPTDITPPRGVKASPQTGSQPAAEPTPTAQPTPAATPSTTAAPANNQPDEFGRLRQRAIEGTKNLSSNDPATHLLTFAAGLLPGDRIQAGIDAAMGLSMMTGAGEAEEAGGVGYNILRQLPPVIRGAGRLAMRLFPPAAGGYLAGATQGRGAEGAERGAGEQAVGEVGSFLLRGTTGLAARAIDKTDITRLSGWLGERMPDLGRFNSMKDFDKLFTKGELEDAAESKLGETESRIEKQLQPKASKATKASTVFSPKEQDVAQDAALKAEQGPPIKQAPVGEKPKSTVFALKPEQEVKPDQLYKRVKDLQGELKAAKDKQAGSRVMDEIRANLKRAQEDARVASANAKTPPKAAEPEIPQYQGHKPTAEEIRAKEAAYQATKPQPTHLEVELPGPMADKMGIPRRQKYPFEFRDLVDKLNEYANNAWKLIGNPDPEKEQLGRMMRSEVVQAEHDASDAVGKRLGKHIGDDWLARRQQARGARVLTQMFRTSGAAEAGATGRVALKWDVLQNLASSAGKDGFYDDLKLAFGKEGADDFINMLTRGEPTMRDVPGRGVLSDHARVYAHPTLEGKANLRIPFQVPIPTIRAGDVPWNLGRNRALTALLILGPDQFMQMTADLLNFDTQIQAQAVKQQQQQPNQPDTTTAVNQ